MTVAQTPDPAYRTGPWDALTDVSGLRVGHAQWIGDGRLTGTTVVLAPEGGAVAAVDVRGGGPGTRETDALDPRNLVQRVDAVVLSGGSAFGLDSASGVAAWLEERGRGFRVGPDPAQVVPVVPAAALFDLGRGGDWRARPDAALGYLAADNADQSGPTSGAPGVPVTQGNVGAGTGAVLDAGALKGGVGTASLVLPDGVTVAALVAVNAVGAACDPQTGALYGASPAQRPVPSAATQAQARRRLAAAREESARRSPASVHRPLNTTLGVVATDAVLTRAQAQKLAGTSHDGLARAIRPVHLLSDGDTVFTLATGERPLLPADRGAFWEQREAEALNGVLAAGAEALMRAVVAAVLAAEGIDGPGGVFPSYRDLYGEPSHDLDGSDGLGSPGDR